MENEYVLIMEHISKQFPGARYMRSWAKMAQANRR
jgi:hypothetical protein